MFASLDARISQIETSDRVAAFRTIDLAEIAAVGGRAVRCRRRGQERASGDAGRLRGTCWLLRRPRPPVRRDIEPCRQRDQATGRDAGRVTVAVTRGEAGAAIAVADDGPGIPAHEMQHVFKRFYRLERSRRTPGNGLGLALVAAVARLHGARISFVDAAPGLGLQADVSARRGARRWPRRPACCSQSGFGAELSGGPPRRPERGKYARRARALCSLAKAARSL